MEYTKEEMRRDMAQAMVDVLGRGYVNKYYYDMSADFVAIAEAYAESRGELRNAHD